MYEWIDHLLFDNPRLTIYTLLGIIVGMIISLIYTVIRSRFE